MALPSSSSSASSGRSTPVRPTRSAARETPKNQRPSSRLSTSTTASGISAATAGAASSTSSRLTAPTFASQARSVSPKKPAPGAAGGGMTTSASRFNLATPNRMAGLRGSAAAHRMGSTPSEKRSDLSRVAETLSVVPNTAPIDLSSLDRANQEAIQAFLRIRPGSGTEEEGQDEPYIQVVNEKEVLMVPPSDTGLPRSRAAHAKLPSTRYTFAKVFPPTDASSSSSGPSQSSFFRETTLPMVYSLLNGESGLIFAYGVTNSGKSYTVVGGKEADEAGLIPRAMDVVFNSVDGLQSESDIFPIGLYGVERGNSATTQHPYLDPSAVANLSKRVSVDPTRKSVSPLNFGRDSTRLKVDRNYRYSVWVSYVEVYNEKLFDLLDAGSSAPSASTPNSPGGPGLGGGLSRSESMRGSNWNLASMGSSTDVSSLTNLHRRPLSLKVDPEGNGKYVAGLREVRVKNVVEARELLKKGQDNRAIFGTMANRTSSRSHGVFTIKVVREHGAGQTSPDESLNSTVSRLSIVDLAGSERISNTDTTGERRKEAGNINKSLMCLGQCVETLRKNQARAAASIPSAHALSSTSTANGSHGASSLIPQPSIISTKFKRRPSVVPFRHSKLTELFQPFFTGEGRTVMIVNANPYDTGFDENNHVMRFSAVAKEVQIVQDKAGAAGTTSTTIHRRLPAKVVTSSVAFPATDNDSDIATPPGTPGRRPNGSLAAVKSRLGAGGASVSGIPSSPRSRMMMTMPPPTSKTITSTLPEISIIEEASSFATAADLSDVMEGSDDEDDDADSSDPFVDLLIARHEELRIKLFEAEKRAREIEAEVREEMATQMAERLAEMERKYTERLLNDAESNEDHFNAKLDLLIRANSSEAQRLRARLDAALLQTPRAGGGRSPRKQQASSSSAPAPAKDVFKTPRTAEPSKIFRTPRLLSHSEEEGQDESQVEMELAAVDGDSTQATAITLDTDVSQSQGDQSLSRSVYLQAGPSENILQRNGLTGAPMVMDESEDELITSPVRPNKRTVEDDLPSVVVLEDGEEEEEDTSEDDEDEDEDEHEESEMDNSLEEGKKRKLTAEDLSFVADDDDDDDDQDDEDEDEDTSMSSCASMAEEDEDESKSRELSRRPGKGQDAGSTKSGKPNSKVTPAAGASTMIARGRESALVPAGPTSRSGRKINNVSSTPSQSRTSYPMSKGGSKSRSSTRVISTDIDTTAATTSSTTRKSLPLRPSGNLKSNVSSSSCSSSSMASPNKKARITRGGSDEVKGRRSQTQAQAQVQARGDEGEDEEDEDEEEEDLVVVKDSPSKRKRLLHAKRSVNEEDLEIIVS